MATLHVRNVPDELYELLRERAAANDRSIGAETVQLLEERLATSAPGAVPRPTPGRRRGGPLARFTTSAREAVAAAQEQAGALGHGHVGTEHLLLGVLAGDRRSALLRLLRELRVTAERVRTQVPPSGSHPSRVRIPFAPAAKQALELALREALTLRDEAVSPAHLVLGILGAEGGHGRRILLDAAPVDASALWARILQARERAVIRGPSLRILPHPSFRVVALEGDADAWETQLNDAATLGYDLVEIVDLRAVLRRV